MPREKEFFRYHLADLMEVFPDTRLLTMNQVCKYLKKDTRTLKKDPTFPLKRNGKKGYFEIPIVSLAKWLSGC